MGSNGKIGELIKSLNEMDVLEYEQKRKQMAEDLGIRVAVLDELRGKEKSTETEDKLQGRPVLFEEVEPWPEEVEGAKLLNELVATINRYVVLPPGAAEAVALWIVHSYALNASTVSPILCITSPQKRCGKTTLLSLLNMLVYRPLPSANITPAAIFRTVEMYNPCLLIDEADSFIKPYKSGGSEDMRGILNSGHLRNQAYVIRTVGDDHEPRLFSTWSPKAISLIGSLPGTLQDRSIEIKMSRKLQDENVERLRIDSADTFKDVRRRLYKWVLDKGVGLSIADPLVPLELNDREADNWRPLLAIGDAVGSEWKEDARVLSVLLTSTDEEDEVGVKLLHDIRQYFDKLLVGDRVASAELVDYLKDLEERPWPHYRKNEKPITARQVARLLKPFGISSTDFKVEGKTLKGYKLEDFKDTFARYCVFIRNSATTTDEDGDISLTDKEIEESKQVADKISVADTSATRNPSATVREKDNFQQDKELFDSEEKSCGVADKTDPLWEGICKEAKKGPK